MHVRDWQQLLSEVVTAKRLPDALYVHPEALPQCLKAPIEAAHHIAAAPPFTLLKLYLETPKLSFLYYPGFNHEGFPQLQQSTTVDLLRKSYSTRNYKGDQAPILHRKEVLLPYGDLRYREWSALTRQAEDAGLFQQTTLIGTMGGWLRVLAEARLRVEGHVLLPVEQSPELIQRHRTALVRYSLSTPMQAMLQHGFLDGSRSVFDYGCGRGGDLAQLAHLGIPASGWDPYFAPEQPKVEAALVNLGFVLNVIEDPMERIEALTGAWAVTGILLVVAVLIGGRSAWEKHRLYRDGVVTSKGTFQKYFSQEELRAYLERHTGRQPIALAPGLFFVFRHDQDEQTFLVERLSQRPRLPRLAPLPHTPSVPKEPRAQRVIHHKPDPWEQNGAIWEAFWLRCLELGRPPEEEELEPTIKETGGPNKVFRQCIARFGEASLVEARNARIADLSVWLALGTFEKRRSYMTLSKSLQRDIRVFWGSWAKAQNAGRALLFSAGDPKILEEASSKAAGWLRDGALYLTGRRIGELPAVLRVVVGCAGVLYGAIAEVDILKIHLKGGKVTLLNFDDFERPIPDLVERVKIDLRRQELYFFSYDGQPYHPQPFWYKAHLLPLEHPDLEAFQKLEARLEDLDLPQNIDRPMFEQRLKAEGMEVRGLTVRRSLKNWLD